MMVSKEYFKKRKICSKAKKRKGKINHNSCPHGSDDTVGRDQLEAEGPGHRPRAPAPPPPHPDFLLFNLGPWEAHPAPAVSSRLSSERHLVSAVAAGPFISQHNYLCKWRRGETGPA